MWTIYKDWVIISKGSTVGLNNVIYLDCTHHIMVKPIQNLKAYELSYNFMPYKLQAVTHGVQTPLCDRCESKYKFYLGDCGPRKICSFALEKEFPEAEIDIKGYFIDIHMLKTLRGRDVMYHLIQNSLFNLSNLTESLAMKGIGKGFIITPELEDLASVIKIDPYNHAILPFIDNLVEPKRYGRVPARKTIALMMAYLYTKFQVTDNKTIIPELGAITSINEEVSYKSHMSYTSLKVSYIRDYRNYTEYFNYDSIQERV